jgi:hypothetical protein
MKKNPETIEKVHNLSTEDIDEIFCQIFCSNLEWKMSKDRKEVTTEIVYKNEKIPVVLYYSFGSVIATENIKSYYLYLYYENGPTINDFDRRVKHLVERFFPK